MTAKRHRLCQANHSFDKEEEDGMKKMSSSSSSSSSSSTKLSVIVLLLFLCFNSCIHCGLAEDDSVPSVSETETVCEGTSIKFAQHKNQRVVLQQLRKRYTGCTYLKGNLELAFMDEIDMDYDLSFLSTIREITGYVLIVGNKVEYIPLYNLRIIRGNKPYIHPKTNTAYSLFISINNSPNNQTGLKELRFTKLTEILKGAVFFQNNNFLCFENTINWQDINPNLNPPVKVINDKEHRRACGDCHPSCHSPITGLRHCWGAGPDMCQTLTNVGCHEHCGERCFGTGNNQCCHPECAGGCTGIKKTDCFACRNMRDEGGCLLQCPPRTLYDQDKMMRINNPDAKYAFGSICVKECPKYMLVDEDMCVNSCPDTKKARDGRNCETCEGGTCPRQLSGRPDYYNDDEQEGVYL